MLTMNDPRAEPIFTTRGNSPRTRYPSHARKGSRPQTLLVHTPHNKPLQVLRPAPAPLVISEVTHHEPLQIVMRCIQRQQLAAGQPEGGSTASRLKAKARMLEAGAQEHAVHASHQPASEGDGEGGEQVNAGSGGVGRSEGVGRGACGVGI